MCKRKKDKEIEEKKKSGGFLGFISFLVALFASVLYIVAMVLKFLDVQVGVIGTLQSVATVIMICIVFVLGWRFVKNRSAFLKVIYVLLVLVVIASVTVPIVLDNLPAQK